MISLKAELNQPNVITKTLFMFIVSTIVLGLGSCTPKPPLATPESSVSPGKELQVVTTFIPITDFTKAVAGDRAKVTQLLPTNVGPHDYQVKPEDAEKLTKADVLVKNGLGVEEFLDNLVKNTGNRNLRIIDSSKGIQSISTAKITGQSSRSVKKNEEFNPHIWLDPKRVIQQVYNIRDGLISADPTGRDIYTANAAAYVTKLKQLDMEFTQTLRPFAGKTFVTYHDFAPYLAESYNLKAQFLVGIPEENPSPEDVKRTIDSAKKSNLKTLLTEPQAVGNPFSALAKDLNVQIGDFDPMETGSTDGIQPDYYFTAMRQNLTNLEESFGGKSR
jgi:zinc transport system substrate-binding protein